MNWRDGKVVQAGDCSGRNHEASASGSTGMARSVVLAMGNMVGAHSRISVDSSGLAGVFLRFVECLVDALEGFGEIEAVGLGGPGIKDRLLVAAVMPRRGDLGAGERERAGTRARTRAGASG